MRLLKFRARGIFSLGDVELNLANQGLTLVTGYSRDDNKSNGSGKSNLVNKGILWTLFGQTGNGLRADRVTNRHIIDNSNVFGEIEFVGRDGQIYSIYRQRNPSVLKLFINSNDVSLRHEKETQRKINDLIGFDITTFCFISVYGQGINNNFISLTPSQKLEIIKKILPLPKLEEWHERAKIASSNIQNKLQEVLFDLKVKKEMYKETQINLEATKEKSRLWEIEKEQKINKLSEDIKKNFLESKGIKLRIKQIEDLLQNFRSYPDNYEEELTSKKNNLLKKKDELDYLKTQYAQKINSINLKIATLESKLIPLEPSNKVCPTCKQPIIDMVFQTLVKEQENIKLQIEKHRDEIKIITSELEAQSSSISIQELESEIKAIDSLLNTYSKENLEKFSLEKELETLKNKSSINLELTKAKLAELSTIKNPYQSSIKEIEDKLKELKVTIEKLENTEIKLNKEFEKVKFWEKAYGKDLKQKMLSVVCPYLEQRTKFHLNGLGNPQFNVKFTIKKELSSGATKEEFNIQVSSNTGSDEFDGLSGGEQSIVNFAVGMALSDLACSQVNEGSNVLILDEPFVELDAVNSENVINHLKGYIANNKESIFLISNDDSFKTIIPNRIHIVKSGGVSTIE